MLTERYGLRTVHKYGHVAELLFTFGLAYLIEEFVHLIWGRPPVDYRVPAGARRHRSSRCTRLRSRPTAAS